MPLGYWKRNWEIKSETWARNVTQKVPSKHKMDVSYISRGNQDSFARMTFLDIAHDAAVCTTAYYTVSWNTGKQCWYL